MPVIQRSIHDPEDHSRTGFFDSYLFPVLLLIIAALAVYSNTLQVPFQFDDPTNITDNPLVRNVRNFENWDVLMQPRSLTNLTLALNFRFNGTAVAGYHVVNILIHLINALLVYALVALLFRTPALLQSSLKKHAGVIALFAALLFVTHPVQTGAVTYIVQRLASLATLFFLASVSAYLNSRLAAEDRRSNRVRYLWYVVALVSAVLAMKSKETAFTLPIMLCLCEFLFFTGGLRKRIAFLLPFLLTMLIIPFSLLGTGKPLGDMVGDVSRVTRLETNLPRTEYLFTEFRVIVTYLRLLLFPVNQNLDYDYPVYQSFFDVPVLLSFLLLASIFGWALFLLHRDRRSPSEGRLVAFGILWFFITLSVESSVIPIADVIFEHRLYLPSVGFFVAATALLFRGVGKLRLRHAVTALIAALSLAVVAFAGLAYARNTVWQSEVSLWQDVIRKSPIKARPYNGLGLAFLNLHEYDRAIECFARAISLNPSYGTAFNNIGSAFYLSGRYDRAVEAHTRAIALQPENAIFRDNRGLVFAAMGDHERAMNDYDKAIALNPSYAMPYHNIGVVLHRRGLYGEAIERYTKAITLDPANSTFRGNRGLAYAEIGDYGKAIADFTQVIFLDPDNVQAYSGRGEVYLRQQRYSRGGYGPYRSAVSRSGQCRSPGASRHSTRTGWTTIPGTHRLPGGLRQG